MAEKKSVGLRGFVDSAADDPEEYERRVEAARIRDEERRRQNPVRSR